jgi:hypothetical protein
MTLVPMEAGWTGSIEGVARWTRANEIDSMLYLTVDSRSQYW